MKYLMVILLAMLIFVACNDEKPKDDHQSAAEMRKKIDERSKNLGKDLEKIAQQQNEKKNREKQNQQNKQNVPAKPKVENKKPVGKTNLFEFLVLQTQANSQNSKLKRKDSLQKLAKITNGKQARLFGVVKNIDEETIPNTENPEEKITQYIVQFQSLFIGNKYLPFHLSFPYSSFIAETKNKSKVIELEKGNFISALGHLKLRMKKNSYDGQNYLDFRFVINNVVKGLDQTAMGLKDINSTLTTSDVVSYMQTAATLKKMKKTFNISPYQNPLKNLGIKANFIGNFKRKDLNERYRKEGNFRFLVSKEFKVFFQEDELLAEILLSMPKTQDVQVRGQITKLKSGVVLEDPSVFFELNNNKYKFQSGNLQAADGKLKVFHFFVAENALLYKKKQLSLDKFYLFLETAKLNASFVNLEMKSSNRLSNFQSMITKLLQGSSIPYKIDKSNLKTEVSTDSRWNQIQELYQVASACTSYRNGYPKELKDVAGRWSRNLRKNLFDDYIYVNSSNSPFLDNDMQKQHALIYPKKSSTKVVAVAFINTSKNAHGYSFNDIKLVLLEKKQLSEVEKIAKGFVKSIDLDSLQKELKAIAKLCKVYQETLGKRFRYPKSLEALIENRIVKNTPQNQKMLQNYDYVYSPIHTFEDNDKKRQQILISPKSINSSQIPVIFINYSNDELSMISKSELVRIKKAALQARDKKK
ncbi:hypothetical protein [Candidatus Uabimicrobium sp. HlEnr_7]|uniref:hypothetical protein n=1 Tax=Candidatus Uabimicrobium helgolandensis TaxID=3095367 RepID=UPI003557643B